MSALGKRERFAPRSKFDARFSPEAIHLDEGYVNPYFGPVSETAKEQPVFREYRFTENEIAKARTAT
jgi:hypothetical protein